MPRTTAHEPERAAKLKALGNAIVPQVAAVILTAVMQVEEAQDALAVAMGAQEEQVKKQ